MDFKFINLLARLAVRLPKLSGTIGFIFNFRSRRLGVHPMPDRLLRRAGRDVGLRAVPRLENYPGCGFYVRERLCCSPIVLYRYTATLGIILLFSLLLDGLLVVARKKSRARVAQATNRH